MAYVVMAYRVMASGATYGTLTCDWACPMMLKIGIGAQVQQWHQRSWIYK